MEVLLLCVLICLVVYSWWRARKVVVDEKLVWLQNKLGQVDSRAYGINFHAHQSETYAQQHSVHICLKTSSGQYHDDNFLIYVGLHELAHVIIPTDTSHHPPEFEAVFANLRKKAQQLNIYDPSVPFPREYCHKEINTYR
jgi:hypothetical protein